MPARRKVPRAPEVSGRRPVAGVMGAGDGASGADIRLAERLGELLAAAGFVVLTGGRDVGVMAAATRGAKKVRDSLTIGILPGTGGAVAQGLDVVIFTGLGLARNAVNILSSDVVVTVGTGGPGTASEVAIAIRAKKPLVLLAPPPEAEAFFRTLDPGLRVAATPEDAVEATLETMSPSEPRPTS
jgi:uncharacterized protein (TIGR00725 family)